MSYQNTKQEKAAMNPSNGIRMQLEELREQMIAQGQNCSEVAEIEPGLYEIKVGKRDVEDTDETGELA